MNKLQEQGFDVNDNNLPNPYDVPDPAPIAINSPPVLNWKTGCIVCPQRASNLQNSFASFRNYSKADVMNISRLDMFLIIISMKFIENTLIKNTN